jgi:hypothetical protein
VKPGRSVAPAVEHAAVIKPMPRREINLRIAATFSQ